MIDLTAYKKGDFFMKEQNKFSRLSFILIAAFVACLGFTSMGLAETGSSLKIGFVDINKIMKESKAAKNAQAVLQKDIDSKKAVIKEKSDKLLNMDKDLKSTKQDSKEWKGKREKLEQEVKEFNRIKQEFDEQIKKKDIELTQHIIDDIQKIIKKLSKDEKYSVIFDKKAAVMIEEGFDLTDKVIKIYDSQKK
jgi:outer membrane protein